MTTQIAPANLKVIAAKHGDLEAYAQAVHGLQIEPYQLVWEEALDTENRTAIVCPPDTFKSTTVQMWVERAIGRNPNIRILWLMNSGSQAMRRVMTVGRTITGNTTYKAAFHVEPDPEALWTKESLYVKRTISDPAPTLMGCGWDGPYQGLHFDVIVLDDLTDQKDVFSPATMEMQRMKLRGVILDRLTEGGRIVSIFTRWSTEDLLPTFEDMGFRVIVMPVVADYPWGPTISNTRFPLLKMDALRRDKTDAIFDLTYMCNPLSMRGGIIKREHINYWDKDNLPDAATYTLMAVDPASSTKDWADPSAIAVGLLEPKSRTLYATDLLRQRVDPVDLEALVVRYAKGLRGLIAIGVETVGYQSSLFQRLRREHHLPVVELPYRSRRDVQTQVHGLDRHKEGRAIYLEYKLSMRQILLAKNLPLFDGVSVESEICSFPYAKHDECVDVLSFLGALADSYSFQRRTRVKIKAYG